MAKILPILIMIVGLAGGFGAGLFLKSEPEEIAHAPPNCGQTEGGEGCAEEHTAPVEEAEINSNVSYVKLSKQFVVPVVKGGRVSALVVMSISIEVDPAASQLIYEKEPKLRDSLLQVMFLHANSGGFEGQFTAGEAMKDLRGSLLEAAIEVFGVLVTDVLVTDILRQDV